MKQGAGHPRTDSQEAATQAHQRRQGTRRRGLARDTLSDKEVEGVCVPILAIIGADGVEQLKKLLPKTKVVVIDKADQWTALNSSTD